MKKSNMLFLNSFPLSILYICMYIYKIDKVKELIMNSILLLSYHLFGIYISSVVTADQTSKIKYKNYLHKNLITTTSSEACTRGFPLKRCSYLKKSCFEICQGNSALNILHICLGRSF